MSLFFVLGVITAIVLSVIVLTIFVGKEVSRRPHIILILADDLGKTPINKCNGTSKDQHIFIYRLQ